MTSTSSSRVRAATRPRGVPNPVNLALERPGNHPHRVPGHTDRTRGPCSPDELRWLAPSPRRGVGPWSASAASTIGLSVGRGMVSSVADTRCKVGP